MKNEFHFRISDGILVWDYFPRCDGAYLWIAKPKNYLHFGEDGFILRKHILSGQVWDIGYCKHFLEHEEEIMFEAKKFLVKEML